VAHVLGFTNIDDRGQEGLELAFDDWLRGTPGAKRVIRDRRGQIVESVDLVRAAQPGKRPGAEHRPSHPVPGAIASCAMRSTSPVPAAARRWCWTWPPAKCWRWSICPTFNPNAVGTSPRDAHRNRAVTDLIEPGSTMKPLTVAAGLEAGVITTTSLFNTSPGWIPNGKYRTTDTHNYGVLDTTGVIRKSSNVGASLKLAKRLGDAQYSMRIPAPLRLRPCHRQRLPGRGCRPVPESPTLERHQQADHQPMATA
jgi:cell division protein FtsI (penicillin-binding protein 3)